MPKISINNLDQILTTELTLDLARNGRTMSDIDAQERLETAGHEGAHLSAAIRCRSYIRSIELHPTTKSSRKPAGRVNSVGILPWHDAIDCFAGASWEANYGEINRAEGDMLQGIQSAKEAGIDPLTLALEAQMFVLYHAAEVVNYAAIGILTLTPRTGILTGQKLARFISWLKPHVLGCHLVSHATCVEREKVGSWTLENSES